MDTEDVGIMTGDHSGHCEDVGIMTGDHWTL